MVSTSSPSSSAPRSASSVARPIHLSEQDVRWLDIYTSSSEGGADFDLDRFAEITSQSRWKALAWLNSPHIQATLTDFDNATSAGFDRRVLSVRSKCLTVLEHALSESRHPVEIRRVVYVMMRVIQPPRPRRNPDDEPRPSSSRRDSSRHDELEAMLAATVAARAAIAPAPSDARRPQHAPRGSQPFTPAPTPSREPSPAPTPRASADSPLPQQSTPSASPVTPRQPADLLARVGSAAQSTPPSQPPSQPRAQPPPNAAPPPARSS